MAYWASGTKVVGDISVCGDYKALNTTNIYYFLVVVFSLTAISIISRGEYILELDIVIGPNCDCSA